jgi:hypothetical protein
MMTLAPAFRACGSLSLLAALFLAAGGLAHPLEGQAQGIDSKIERQAQEAFHGPDLEGKDGPMAKAGLDLALLYFRFLQAEEEAGEFDPGDGYQLMKDGRVVVDAIAQSGSTKVLREELSELGARNVASAGRVVSGALPIKQIPEASALSVLRSMQPARARTHGQSEASQKREMSGLIEEPVTGAPEEGNSGPGEEKPPGSELGILLLIGTFLLVERT